MANDAAIARIETALCERYNVQTPQELGPLSEALAAARGGNFAALKEAIAERDMYRWQVPLEAALAELHVEVKPVEVPAAEPEADEAPAEPEAEPEPAQHPAPHRRGRARSE